MIWMSISFLASSLLASVRDSYLILSRASEEVFLVRVEGVDDQGHQLGDLSLEGECFHFFCH